MKFEKLVLNNPTEKRTL